MSEKREPSKPEATVTASAPQLAIDAEQARLRAMHRLMKTIGSSLDQDEVLSLARDLISEMTGAQSAAIYLLNEGGGELVIRASETHEAISLDVSRGVAGWVARTGESLILDSGAPDDSRFDPEVDQDALHLTDSIACVPMKNRHGRALGVVQARNKQSGSFTADDIALLETFAASLAITVENGRLFISVVNKNLELLDTKEQLAESARLLEHHSNTVKPGLSLYFKTRTDRLDRYLIDGVIVGVLGRHTDCEVTELQNRPEGAVILLSASRLEDLIAVAEALYQRLWEPGTLGGIADSALVAPEVGEALSGLGRALTSLTDESLRGAVLRVVSEAGKLETVQEWGFGRSLPSSELTILFFSSNSDDESPLAVDKEYRRVRRELSESHLRGSVHLECLPDLHLDDFPKELRRLRPIAVHFSGHGGPDGELFMRDHDGVPASMSADGVADMLGHCGTIRLVVLNACFSESLATRLKSKCDYVVGMRYEVMDDAAILFSQAFYSSLFDNESVEDAFYSARNLVMARYPDEADSPQLVRNTSVPSEKATLGVWGLRPLHRRGSKTPYAGE